MIELNNVNKYYKPSKKTRKKIGLTSKDNMPAVENLSFKCQPGRVFSLLGANGAGKTTTLRMIATLIKPTSGQILINNVDNQTNARDTREKIGFLTGSTHLYNRLTPTELIKYFADLQEVDKNEYKQRVDEIFTTLGIHEFAKKRISELSTGMKQKVSVARTMIHDPEILIFDEPTSGLDVITAKSIIQLIKNSRSKGKTVLFSTHIMSEVDLLCDDLAIIDKGKLIYNDTFSNFKMQSANASLTERFITLVENN